MMPDARARTPSPRGRDPYDRTMPDLPVLDALDRRILGALLEKQRTVPATYPLSLNALRTACNQTTSRDPVTTYDEATLEQRCRELKQRGLVRVVWAGQGSRVLKYHHLLSDELGLDAEGSALVTVLLLRGAQTAGELRTRCERLHPFADKEAADAALRRLAAATPPLVRELERRPGEKDRRWVDLLGAPAAPEAAPDAARETILDAGPAARDARVLAAYEAVADAYAADPVSEVAHPFDAWLLDRIPDLAGAAPIADLGCGPGHATARLAASGAEVVGFDPSPAMLAAAERHHPDVPFQRAWLAQFLRPRTAPGWGAVVAWFSLIHLAASELADAFDALARTLVPGGTLLVALHAGQGVAHLDTWLGNDVDLDVVLHEQAQVADAAASVGLDVVETYLRGRTPDEPHDRIYLLARRPG